jgi:hypothetical protein
MKQLKVIIPTKKAAAMVVRPEPEEPEPCIVNLKGAFELLNDTNPQLLKDFLIDPKPWNDPASVPQRGPHEKASHFSRRLRQSNKNVKHWEVVKGFFPRCVLKPEEYQLRGLPEAQMQGVKDLLAFYTGEGWSGFRALFPFPDMQQTTYDAPAVHKAACVVEGIRRALKLEAALATQTQYAVEVLRAATSLSCLADRTQQSVRLLLEFHNVADIDPRLSTAPPIEEVRGFMGALRELRPEAFNPRYVHGTPLGWMLSAVGFLFANRQPDLMAEGALNTLLEAIKKEWRLRAQIYTDCSAPLFKYGGILTRCVGSFFFTFFWC